MKGPQIYHSTRSNRVFVGQTTLAAHNLESTTNKTYQPTVDWVYTVAYYGFPQSGKEVDNLILVAKGRRKEGECSRRAQDEAYRLIRIFTLFSEECVPALRDNAMKRAFIWKPDIDDLREPIRSNDREYVDGSIPLDPKAWASKADNKTGGFGVNRPASDDNAFDLGAWARFLLLSARPGRTGFVYGMAIDRYGRIHK